MASIEKRGERSWRVVWRQRDADGKRIKSSRGGFRSKRQAERFADRVERALQVGGEIPTPRSRLPLMSEAEQIAYAELVRLRRKRKTLEQYANAVVWFVRWWAATHRTPDPRVDEITKRDLIDFNAHTVQRGCDQTYANHMTGLVYVVLREVEHDDRWSDQYKAPARPRLPRPPPPKMKNVPTWAQADAAVEAAHGWLRDLLMFQRGCPLRKAQVMNLKRGDIDLKEAVVTVRESLPGSKSVVEAMGRKQPIPRWLADELAGWGRWDDDAWLIDRTKSASPSGCLHPNLNPDLRETNGVEIGLPWRRIGVTVKKGSHIMRSIHRTRLLHAGHPKFWIDVLQGRYGTSVGAKHYTDWMMLVDQMRPIVEAVPAPAPAADNVLELDQARRDATGGK